MARDNSDNLGRMIGYGPRIEDRVRPERVAAVKLHLVGAVRVHVKEQAREIVRCIRILPSRKQDPTVVEHRRAPVVVLIEAEHADVRAVGMHDAQIGHGIASCHAGDPLETPGRCKDDPAVREVARVIIIDIGIGARRDLAKPGAVGVQLPDLPAVMRPRHGDQHLAAIEMQVHVAHEARSVRLEECCESAVGRNRAHDADLVVVAGARDRTVALPVLGKAQIACSAFDQQQLVKIEQRICEQRIALQRSGLDCRFAQGIFRPGPGLTQGLSRLLDRAFQSGQPCR